MGNINKKIRLKGETMARAWKELAPEDTFGGTTLAEFNDLLGRVQAANQRLVKLAGLTIEARLNRDNLHAELNRISQNVVNGVRAEPVRHGPDSGLYKTMGYVPQGERASGLTRKKKKVPAADVPPAEAAGQ